MNEYRVPPHDIAAESSVLGALMLDPNAATRVADFLKPADFYLDIHAQIYKAALNLTERSAPIDLITMTDELDRMTVLDRVGGPGYLAELESAVPTAANVEHYGRIVEELSAKRRLIDVAGRIAALGFDEATKAQDALNEAERAVFNVAEGRGADDLLPLKDSLALTWTELERMHKDNSLAFGVPSGFRDVDAITGGWQRSDLIIIAARPSVGKTAFVLNVAQHAAMQGTGVAFFSLEMSRHQLNTRMLCAAANIEGQRLRMGLLKTEEWPNFTRAMGELSETSIWVDDSASISALEIRTRARRLKAKHKLGLVIVDYLQLVTGRSSARGGDYNRVQEVAEISRSLKAMARELDIPVIACSQLSRQPEMRANHRPLLSDLRDSGAVEQDADLVLFLYREALYNSELSPEKKRIAEVIIAKHRNGPTGKVDVVFIEAQTKFADLERRQAA